MPDPFRDLPDTLALPAAANPFTPGAGKVPPAFGGRDAPLLTAKSMVDKLAIPTDPVDMPLLRGVRGVGKTALMAYTRHHATASGTVALHIEADAGDEDLTATCRSLLRDAHPLTSALGDLARRLSSLSVVKGQVSFHPPSDGRADINLEALLHDLVLLAERRNVGLLLTVDEVHEAEDLLLRPLIRAVHRHAQDARAFGVMFSGLPGAGRALLEEGQTYAERIATFDLGLLPLPGVEEAIRRPFVEDGGIDVADEVLAHIHADTGGYPYFVQIWGGALWTTLPELREVRLADVVRAQTLVDVRRETFFSSRWQRMPHGRAQDLGRALARSGGSASVSGLVEALGLGEQRQLSQARDALIRDGQVYSPRRGRLEFTVPGFASWLATQPEP